MKRLISATSAVALIAALFGAGPRQALACSCSGIQADESYARRLVDSSDLMVIGSVVSYSGLLPPPTPLSGASPQQENDAPVPLGPVRATIRIDRSYGATSPAEVEIVTVDSAGCGYSEGLHQGGRHFMALTLRENGTYNASYCSSFPMADAETPRGTYEETYLPFLDTLAQVAPTQLITQRTSVPLNAQDLANGGASPLLITGYVAGSVIALGALVWGSRLARGSVPHR